MCHAFEAERRAVIRWEHEYGRCKKCGLNVVLSLERCLDLSFKRVCSHALPAKVRLQFRDLVGELLEKDCYLIRVEALTRTCELPTADLIC